MKQIFDWVVKSSADPEKVSLTIKGGIVLAAFVGIDSSVVTQVGNELAHLIATLGIAVSSGVTLYGLLRKIYITLTDTD